MWDACHNDFGRTLGRAERSLVQELREVRNRWAHQETFYSDDAYQLAGFGASPDAGGVRDGSG